MSDTEAKVRDIIVELLGVETAQDVLYGMWADNRIFANAKLETADARCVRVPAIPGLGARYLRWVVRGEITGVRVSSVKGGTDAWQVGRGD